MAPFYFSGWSIPIQYIEYQMFEGDSSILLPKSSINQLRMNMILSDVVLNLRSSFGHPCVDAGQIANLTEGLLKNHRRIKEIRDACYTVILND
jgi:hypothetical protein